MSHAHEDHDQVLERLIQQAVLDGIDPAFALEMSAEEYEELRDALQKGAA